MKAFSRSLLVVLALAFIAVAHHSRAATGAAAKPTWSANMTAIEACSCPVFCQCYFNTSPAGHGGHEGHEGHEAEHFCRFNNAYKINHGTFGATKLDGATFWIHGDLGGDFTKGMDWAVVTFDKKVTKAQREAIGEICAHLFPVKWNSLTTAEGDIAWTAGKEEAYATLDGGKSNEVRLKKFKGTGGEAVVIRNLPYWGSTKNDGFIVMPNSIEASRMGDKTYEFHGTNGFMITFDIDSKSAPPAATGM